MQVSSSGPAACNDPIKVAAHMRSHPVLFRYWIRILRSYAVEGWPPPRPLPQVSGIRQSVLRIQLLEPWSSSQSHTSTDITCYGTQR
jgi:hypothetical protein